MSRPAGADDQTRKTAVNLYGHGLSLRCVGKLLATTAQSVIRWVTEYVETRCSKPAPEGAVVIEVDEMWHYLGSKATKLWIWTALDRATGRLIDWEYGGRDQMTFERLLARLRRWNVRLICTDEYVVYEQSLAAGQHYAGKDQTIALEHTHSRLRHWLAPFRRRTCVVSRSREMPLAHPKDALPARQRRLAAAKGIDRSIALIAHLHINQQVDPSFCRLTLPQAAA